MEHKKNNTTNKEKMPVPSKSNSKTEKVDDKRTMEERVQIVKTFYLNKCSVKKTQTVLSDNNKEAPSAEYIKKLIEVFEKTGSVDVYSKMTGLKDKTGDSQLKNLESSEVTKRTRKIEKKEENGKTAARVDMDNGIIGRKQKKEIIDVKKSEPIVQDVEAAGSSRSRKAVAGADTNNGNIGRKQKKEIIDVIKSEPIVQDVEAAEPSRSRKAVTGADTNNGNIGRKQKKESKTVSAISDVNREEKSNDSVIDVIKSESIVQDVEVAGPSRRRKRKISDENQDQLVGSKVIKNITMYNKDDFEITNSSLQYNLKISTWNVAGLRSWVAKDGLTFLKYENPDIFCMQETKCTTDQLPEEAARIPGYHPYWLCMPGGYAGVALYSKIMPINVDFGIKQPEFDDVGRVITAEYEKFFLVNVYVPNSGRKLVNLDKRMIWEEKFKAYVQSLDKLKPVIICGDMNVAHKEIDLKNPKTNTKTAGFTKNEREKMSELLAAGFVDTFRHLYPNKEDAFTFWSYMRNARAKNVGWRLDYFLVSERIIQKIVDNCIRQQCLGSDHCPITLYCQI